MEAAVASAIGHVGQDQTIVDNERATEADLLQAKVHLSTLKQKHIEVRNMMSLAGENIKLLTAVTTSLPVVTMASPESEAKSLNMPSSFE